MRHAEHFGREVVAPPEGLPQFRELYLSKAARDRKARKLRKLGERPYRSSVRNVELHPQHLKDVRRKLTFTVLNDKLIRRFYSALYCVSWGEEARMQPTST